MEPIGYPSFFLYLVVLIGIPLSLAKPYIAFLMVAFLYAAADTVAFTFTRTKLLGPYFNANDACLLIALMALLPYMTNRTKQIQFPRVTKWIIAVLLIGFVQSWFIMGWSYETLRALRWAINFPVYFIIAATIIDRKEKVWPLIVAIFLGSVAGALQHMIFVQSRINIYGFDTRYLRSVSFLGAGPFFILASLIWIPKIKERDKIILIGACILFVISMLLSQTRSIWYPTIAVLPIALLLYRQKRIDFKIIKLSIVVPGLIIGVFAVTYFIAPKIDLTNMLTERFGSYEMSVSNFQRLFALKLELEAWLGGTLIFGRGLSYFDNQPGEYVAWGHLGHLTTLAQLGIIGLVVYSFYLPITIIKVSKKLWKYADGEVKFLGLFAGIAMMWYWICFITSGSFLSPVPMSGVIVGAAWRQAMLITTKTSK